MGAQLITVVTPSTDALTIPAHGLITGDGFLAIYANPGTYPGGLAAVTNYWAIVVDANNIKLATSSANAFANVWIDITSTGSGTLYLLQGLPYRVPRIAAPLTQAFSADANGTWQSLVALWNLLTGQAESIFNGNITIAGNLKVGGALSIARSIVLPLSPSRGQVRATTVSANWFGAGGAFSPQGINDMLVLALPFKPGDEITQVQAFVHDLGVGVFQWDFALWKTPLPYGGPVQIGATQTSTGAAGNKTLTIGGLTETIPADYVYFVTASPNSASVTFGSPATANAFEASVVVN